MSKDLIARFTCQTTLNTIPSSQDRGDRLQVERDGSEAMKVTFEKPNKLMDELRNYLREYSERGSGHGLVTPNDALYDVLITEKLGHASDSVRIVENPFTPTEALR